LHTNQHIKTPQINIQPNQNMKIKAAEYPVHCKDIAHGTTNSHKLIRTR